MIAHETVLPHCVLVRHSYVFKAKDFVICLDLARLPIFLGYHGYCFRSRVRVVQCAVYSIGAIDVCMSIGKNSSATALENPFPRPYH